MPCPASALSVRTSAFVHSRRSTFLSADMCPSMRVIARQDCYSIRLFAFATNHITGRATLRSSDECVLITDLPRDSSRGFFVPSPSSADDMVLRFLQQPERTSRLDFHQCDSARVVLFAKLLRLSSPQPPSPLTRVADGPRQEIFAGAFPFVLLSSAFLLLFAAPSAVAIPPYDMPFLQATANNKGL